MPEEFADPRVARALLSLRLMTVLQWPLIIVAAAAPMYFVYRSVDSLAGETTRVVGIVQIAVVFSVSLAGLNAFFLYNAHRRKQELQRTRVRLKELEEENEELRKENEELRAQEG